MGCTEWFELAQKNRPQSIAIMTGIMTLHTTSMHHAATLYDFGYRKEKWTYNLSNTVILMTLILFHITAIIGSLAAWTLVERFTKKRMNFVIMSFAIIGCTLGITVSQNLIGVVCARSLMGLSHGMAYLVVLIHASEISVKELRGFITARVNIAVLCGILAGAIVPFGFAGLPYYLLLGFLWLFVFFLNLFLCYESPVFLLQHNHEAEASRHMIKLHNEPTLTWDIHYEMNEIKTMLSEDVSTKRSIFMDGNLRPLMLIVLGKIASILSFNYAINTVKANVIDRVLDSDKTDALQSIIILLLIRIVVGTGVMFTVDLLGRRTLQLVSTFSTGLVLVATGVVYLITDSISPNIVIKLFIICEVGSSLGLTSIPDVLCCEAFNTKKKALSIVMVQILEQLLHLVVFTIVYKWEAVVQNWYGETLLAAGIPLLVIGFVLYRELPETSKMSLRQARIMFYQQEPSEFFRLMVAANSR